MTQVRARLALLAMGLAAVAGFVAPTQAGAAVSYFSCVNKPSDQWCDGRANGTYDGQNSWDWVESWHTDGGVHYDVCQRVYRPSTGGVLGGDGCHLDYESNYYGDVQCVCYDAEIAQLSGSPKTIYGFADSVWP